MLVTETILSDVTPTRSLALTASVTGTMRLFGCRMIEIEGVSDEITGLEASCTVIVKPPVVVLPAASVATTVTGVVPIGNVLPEA